MLLLQTGTGLEGGSHLLKMPQWAAGRAVSTQTSLSPAGLAEAFTDILVKLKLAASFLQVATDTLNFGHGSSPIKANMHTWKLHVKHLFCRSPKPAQKSNPSLRDHAQSSVTNWGHLSLSLCPAPAAAWSAGRLWSTASGQNDVTWGYPPPGCLKSFQSWNCYCASGSEGSAAQRDGGIYPSIPGSGRSPTSPALEPPAEDIDHWSFE